ncbi:hypothetical protein AB0E00_36855 [Streptomyces sp. NPDC048110]|uniref:hypothetical protein n=1 Tax=Streptomyces sp. NPDC048110 TaxID=3155483 RepID=UPI0033F5543B
MISFAQVVAALAAGAVLTVAAMLVCRQYGAQRPADKPGPSEGGETESDPDDAEWKIEAARSLGFAAVETFRHHIADSPTHTQHRATGHRPDVAAGSATLVRSKGHLALLACGRRIEAGRFRPGVLGEPRRLAEHQGLGQR